MRRLIGLLLGLFAFSAVADVPVAAKFEELSARVPLFDLGRFLWDYPSYFGGNDRKESTGLEAEFAALADATSVSEFEILLRHSDPRVRTLALAGLFRREDPKALPLIAGLAADSAATFLRPASSSQGLRFTRSLPPGVSHMVNWNTPKFPEEQSVGSIACRMLNVYLGEPGGGDGSSPEVTVRRFEEYWTARKDRTYCASWFGVRLNRATRGSFPPSRERQAQIERVRRDVEKLPGDDAVIILLWLRSLYPDDSQNPEYSNLLVRDEDLVGIAKTLGSEKLLRILARKSISEDPDLLPDANGLSWVGGFILRHAAAILRPEDAEALISLGTMDSKSRGPQWWIAAAELQPTQAAEILRQGYDFLQNTQSNPAAIGPLVVRLWEIQGNAANDFVIDWFYSQGAVPDRFSGTWAGERFIEAVAQSKSPSAKSLLAQVIKDPRAETLHPDLVAEFAEVINRWLPAPLVSQEELSLLHGYRGKGGGPPQPKSIPGIVGRLQDSVPQWEK